MIGGVILSRSLTWCRQIAQDMTRSRFADRNWNNAAEEIETIAVFDEFLRGCRHWELKAEGLSVDVGVTFDANADFEYFTSESCVHDGTLLFVRQTMDQCVRNVCLAQTYDKRIGEPRDGDKIHYVVGNLVVLTEHDGDFVSADTPWKRERTTVLLPLKMIKL